MGYLQKQQIDLTTDFVIQIGAVAAAAALVFPVRGRSSFRATLFGASGLVLSLIPWAARVAPANASRAESD